MSAYIFEGEDTAAVRNQALTFAKKLNCVTAAAAQPLFSEDMHSMVRLEARYAPASEPCNQCLSCRTFDSGNHPDTIFVKGTKQSGIGVDDVREQILQPMAIKPFKYEHKVFIVDNAETLTPAAQNALLKTIEEPAPYGFFLFLAPNTHSFLPTVLSRCSIKKIRGTSKEITADSEMQTLAEELIIKLATADITEAFALYRKVDTLTKDALQELLDLLYLSIGEKISISAGFGELPPQSLFASIEAITRTKHILAQNGNTQLALELMFLAMSRNEEIQ